MAENKQSKSYIQQYQENGSVLISEDVIAAIVAQAAAEVDGAAGFNVKPGEINKKTVGKNLKITIGPEDEVYIDCTISVVYGQSVIDVAKAVQEAVTSALESMAGVTVAAVNVNVGGILRK